MSEESGKKILFSSNPWSSYMGEIYSSRRGPQPLGTVVFEEIEAKAREKLKDYGSAFMYAGGSAGTNSTEHANVREFKKWGIIPRMLVDASTRTLDTTIFGVKYSAPLFIGPIGVQATFHPDGEFNPARACRNLKVPMILSSAASRSMEQVAAENGPGSPRWYQLYWPRDDAITLSLLKRAKDNGYTALVVTLDTMNLGWRPHDLATSYIPFAHGVGIQIGKSDPVFMAKFGKQPVLDDHPEFPYDPAKYDAAYAAGDPKIKEYVQMGAEWLKQINSGFYRTWEDVKFLRDNWEGPLILKGIQSVHDAEKAMDFGVNGIIVSNHGGRQVDGAIPSLLALEHIMKSPKIKAAQKSGELTILFDSGIRTGADIFKALALGAQAVLIGRPWLYGSIVAGSEGVEQVIKIILAELDNTLALSGYNSIDQIQGKADEVLLKLS